MTESQKPDRHFIEVIDPIPILDSGRFDGMQRVASLMARSTLTPNCLRMSAMVDEDGEPVRDDRNRPIMQSLPYENILANCFLVVNQSVRWGLDPFAVAQCVSVVGGKLCYEGKLVAGVLDAKLGIELSYAYNDKTGDALGVIVSGRLGKRGEVKTVEGTVGDWKTVRKGSPWAYPGNHRRMLAYRGAREWARIHKPSIMLGVYTDDEMESLEARPRSIAPVQHALGKPRETQAEEDIKLAEERAFLNGEPMPGASVRLTDDGAIAGIAVISGTISPAPVASITVPAPAPENDDAPPPPSDPTDDASYIAHATFWAGQASDRAACLTWWKSERALRARLNLTGETVDACKKLIEERFPQ